MSDTENRRDERAREAREARRALLEKLREQERRGESGRLVLWVSGGAA